LDNDGRVKSVDSTLHVVVISHGAPYSRLLAEDGRRLDSGQSHREEERMVRELTRSARDGSGEQRAFQEELRDRRVAMRQLSDAFHWTLHGTSMHCGQPVWVLRARPRAGWRPPTKEARMLSKVAGEVWIDQRELRMVKIDAHVEATLSFAWFLLRIQPGFLFRFEQIRWEDGTWLPRRAFVKGEARIAAIKTVRLEIDTQYSGYRRNQNESRIVASVKGAGQ